MGNELSVIIRDLDIVLSFAAVSDDGNDGIRMTDIANEIRETFNYEMPEADFVDEIDRVVMSIREQILRSVGVDPYEYDTCIDIFEDEK